jgi:hypothetical protein
MAFVITVDHARQEAVYERLSYERDASTIRGLLTETHVAATDRRAVFVGVEAYTEAGGTILRDLFTEDRGARERGFGTRPASSRQFVNSSAPSSSLRTAPYRSARSSGHGP